MDRDLINQVKKFAKSVWHGAISQIKKLALNLKRLALHLKKWEPYFTIIELLLILLSLYISLKGIRESSEFGGRIENHLKNIDSLFVNIQGHLSQLPAGIKAFDSTTKILNSTVKSEQQEFQHSLQILQSNINLFSNSLLDYKDRIEEIANVTKKQLDLLKATLKQQEEELSKKPLLRLDVNSIMKVNDSTFRIYPTICNYGNKIAQNVAFNLYIPIGWNFSSVGWKLSGEKENVGAWFFKYEGFIGYGTKPEDAPCITPKAFDFCISPPLNSEIEKINYAIWHENGSDNLELIINLKQAQGK